MVNLEGIDLGSCTVLHRVPSRFAEDVYRVRQAASGADTVVRIVAATLAPSHPLASPEASAAFARTAAAVSALEQPHILPLYDFGERNGLRYMIVPDVPGGSLADYLAPGSGHVPPLLLSTTAVIAGQAAAALQHAHDTGLMHSTLNLHTLLLRQAPTNASMSAAQGQSRPIAGDEDDESGEVRIGVLDFGLSRYLPGSSLAVPRAPVLECVAPEQRTGVGRPASDQYALAHVLYLLLVGQPFDPKSISGVSGLPSRLNPALPPAVDEVLATALAAEPDERFPRVIDFATALWTALRPAAYAQRAPAVVSVPNAARTSNAADSINAAAGPLAISRPFPPRTYTPDGVRTAGSQPGTTVQPGTVALGNPTVKHAPLGAARFEVDPYEARITRRRALIMLGTLGAAGVAAVGGGYYAWRHHLFGPASARGAAPNLGVLTGHDGIGVFRPSAGTFSLVESWERDGNTLVVVLGQPGNLPLAGDWNGSGIESIGVFRPIARLFALKGGNSTKAPLAYSIPFGQPGDLPVVGDWLGKGHTGIGVFRPSQGLFLLKQTLDNSPPDLAIAFGAAGDIPVAGDWDGDGVAGIGVYRPSDDQFYLANTLVNNTAAKVDFTVALQTGAGRPVAGRWSSDGKRYGVGILVSDKAYMYLKHDVSKPGPPDLKFAFGQPGDLPVAGRWAR